MADGKRCRYHGSCKYRKSGRIFGKRARGKVVAITGSKSEIVYRDLPHDDPKERRLDITKARGLRDWEPTVQLEAGLSRTICYFEEMFRAW